MFSLEADPDESVDNPWAEPAVVSIDLLPPVPATAAGRQVFSAAQKVLAAAPDLARRPHMLGQALADALPCSMTVLVRRVHPPCPHPRAATQRYSPSLCRLPHTFVVVRPPPAPPTCQAGSTPRPPCSSAGQEQQEELVVEAQLTALLAMPGARAPLRDLLARHLPPGLVVVGRAALARTVRQVAAALEAEYRALARARGPSLGPALPPAPCTCAPPTRLALTPGWLLLALTPLRPWLAPPWLQGRALPPWRSAESLVGRWLSPCAQDQLLQPSPTPPPAQHWDSAMHPPSNTGDVQLAKQHGSSSSSSSRRLGPSEGKAPGGAAPGQPPPSVPAAHPSLAMSPAPPWALLSGHQPGGPCLLASPRPSLTIWGFEPTPPPSPQSSAPPWAPGPGPVQPPVALDPGAPPPEAPRSPGPATAPGAVRHPVAPQRPRRCGPHSRTACSRLTQLDQLAHGQLPREQLALERQATP
ncbi:hypothetical protein QJQ45_019498 [Haematococcus lacustris]|nr:hypothetical protein QJQ45_019498 [Haematococcus lacustris]